MYSLPVFSMNVVLLIVTLVVGITCTIPKFIHVCHRNDPDLATCINNSIATLKPQLTVGIPELEVPAIEPLLLNTIEIRSGSNATRIGATLLNLKIWGPSSFIIEELRPNLAKNIFKFKVLLPKLHVEGNYKADAKILFVNVKGEGPANINLTDYRFECKLKGNIIQRDGEEYLKFEKMKLNIDVGKTSIRLENLFNGDTVLGKATSDVISDNAELFVNEIKPNLQNALSETFTDIANKITLRFTYKELFP